MVKNLAKLLTIVSLCVLFIGCSTKTPQQLVPFTPQTFDASLYQGRVNNFLIIMDASSSEGEKINGLEKFEIVKAVISRLNQTVPNVGFNAALRTFGHNPAVSKDLTHLFYGPEQYSPEKMAEALSKVTLPGGTSPMAVALLAGIEDLKTMPGTSAVILISDGEKINPDAITAAEQMKETIGANTCIYTILAGNDPAGKELMDKIAQIGGCGSAINAEQVLSGAGMANFVDNSLVALIPPVIVEEIEEVVEAIDMDSDGDGVLNNADRCPNTPKGAIVDIYGCWSIGNILFDFDKSVIKSTAYPELNGVAAILVENPNMNIILQGFTDNIGPAQFNMGLSLRRSKAVMNYLVHKGINGNRILCEGFGLNNPIAPNNTSEGRALNRRVQIRPAM